MPDAKPLSPDELDARLEQAIVGQPMPRGRNLLGVEYERLLLHRETRAAAPVAFSQRMLTEVGDELGGAPVLEDGVLKGLTGDGFDLSLEPGGQLEVAAPPYPNLDGIDELFDRVTTVLERRLAATDYELVCLGHTPVTPVDDIVMLDRHRYRIMSERMPARGDLSRNMMRGTAGFQLTYDVADRDDAAGKLAMLYRLSPLLMALTANSREVAGVDTGFASFRHEVWLRTDRDRSWIPMGCLEPGTAIAGYIDYAKRAHALFLTDAAGELVSAPNRPFAELVADGVVRERDLDLHLSALFPFVRLRNYIEVRCFDSVPWPHARSVLALVSGLVYCRLAFAAAWELSDALVADSEDALLDLHHRAARDGLDAVAPDGSPFRSLADHLIKFAAATLGKATCDWAKPDDLDVVRELVAGGR